MYQVKLTEEYDFTLRYDYKVTRFNTNDEDGSHINYYEPSVILKPHILDFVENKKYSIILSIIGIGSIFDIFIVTIELENKNDAIQLALLAGV